MVRYMTTIGLLLSAAMLHAQEGNTERDDNFYLLRTGYLLEGTATLEGKQYVVQTPFGSMKVPVQNIEFVGKTKTDVYLYKRSCVDPMSCYALIRFAEWCISNDLLPEGIAEYQRARLVTPAETAGFIQQRLDALQKGDTDSDSELPAPQTATPPDVAVSKVLFDDFVRKVQPILLNRCSVADCHGKHSEQQFKMGIPQESLGSTSRRNLQAVLAYIDVDDPMESSLLAALVTPHGGAKRALSVESGQYIQTVQWIKQVARSGAARELSRQQHSEKLAKADISAPIRVSALPEQFQQAIPREDYPNLPELIKQKESYPLDPDVFNEKYHRTLGRQYNGSRR